MGIFGTRLKVIAIIVRADELYEEVFFQVAYAGQEVGGDARL